jgi:hypothetical protein
MHRAGLGGIGTARIAMDSGTRQTRPEKEGGREWRERHAAVTGPWAGAMALSAGAVAEGAARIQVRALLQGTEGDGDGRNHHHRPREKVVRLSSQAGALIDGADEISAAIRRMPRRSGSA